MRIREHHGFGHGLRPGDDQDINCTSCKAERLQGVTPRFTGTDSPLDQAADEVAAQLIRMAQESPDGMAFLARVIERIAQVCYVHVNPLREV